jgi:hypothetical protein
VRPPTFTGHDEAAIRAPKTSTVRYPEPRGVNQGVIYPEIPAEWCSFDPSLFAIPPTLPSANEENSTEEGKLRQTGDFRFGLRNLLGECYKNAGLQCRLHNPQFYHWLMGHSDTGDADAGAECLTCRLRDIAKLYFPPFGDRGDLYNRLNAFDAQVRHEFWGERSKLWKTGVKIGTEDGIGGSTPCIC